jgi:hypothetical protein
VLDVSRSMQASVGRAGPTRLERAKALAVQVRAELGDVPAGLGSLTDRALPYLFPTPNVGVFNATVRESIAIESPPPAARFGNSAGRATTLTALVAVATANYYSRDATQRLLIVLSDDESLPFEEASIGAVFRKRPRVHTIFVRFWNARERIYLQRGGADPIYRPDRTSEQAAATLAAATNGNAFDEHELRRIVRTARADLGRGEVRKQRLARTRTPIAAWVALAAVLPLGLVLRRRNL